MDVVSLGTLSSAAFVHIISAYYDHYEIIIPTLSFCEEDFDRERSVFYMKFSCEKALLQSAISTASQAVSPKSSIPHWKAFFWRHTASCA